MPSSIANVEADPVGETLVGIGVTDALGPEGLEAAGASCITEMTANVASPATATTASSVAILVAFLARAGALTRFTGAILSTHPLRSYCGDRCPAPSFEADDPDRPRSHCGGCHSSVAHQALGRLEAKASVAAMQPGANGHLIVGQVLVVTPNAVPDAPVRR
jgi:ribosomal protein S27AE